MNLPYYIIRQAPPGATLKDASDALVIEFAGNYMQLAEKIREQPRVVVQQRQPNAKKRKSKSGSQLKGKLKPFNGQVPASVFTLRLCREPHSLTDISNAWPGSSHTTIASAVSRMLNDLNLERVPNSDKLQTTNEGLAALKDFDATYPACAENATTEPQQPQE